MYEAPFEYVGTHVKPDACRIAVDRRTGPRWWLHAVAATGNARGSRAARPRFSCTPTVAKHRVFVWLAMGLRCRTSQLIVFARHDDYFFGVLHSRAHEVWSLRMGTSLGVGTTRATPRRPASKPSRCPGRRDRSRRTIRRVQAIAEAARELNALRENWLNPPDAAEAELKKRTLTNLYNARPAWLQHAHAALDRAVWAAYGWDDPDPAAVPEDDILARLLALNQERAAGQLVSEIDMKTAKGSGNR